jgi:cystathionine gamma-synthase
MTFADWRFATRVVRAGGTAAADDPRDALERALGQLEGGMASVFASGRAAEHALITAVAHEGAHVVIPGDGYGGTLRLVDQLLARWGLEHTAVDQTDPAAVAAAVRPETKLIWIESPSNSALDTVDIAAIVAAKQDALVAVDSTYATPVYQRPLELGADAVVHSTAKYLGGDVGGAVVVRNEHVHGAVRFVQEAVGAVLGAQDCLLVHRGLATLHVRMAAHTENARAVSTWLQTAPGVSDVRWPGFAGMVAFRHPEAERIADETRLFAHGQAAGATASSLRVDGDRVRLSCGIEDAEDLIADLAAAIEG